MTVDPLYFQWLGVVYRPTWAHRPAKKIDHLIPDFRLSGEEVIEMLRAVVPDVER